MYVLPFLWVLGLVLGYAPFQRRTHFNSEASGFLPTLQEHTHIHIKHLALTLAPNCESDVDSTPANMLTLGELLSHLQVRVLKKERFALVLGADYKMRSFVLLRLGKNMPSKCGVWRFTKTMCRLNAELIARLILQPPGNPEIEKLFSVVSNLRVISAVVHSKMLERVTIDLFQF